MSSTHMYCPEYGCKEDDDKRDVIVDEGVPLRPASRNDVDHSAV